MSLPDDLCLHLEELIAKAQEGPLIATVAKVLGVLEAANLAFRAKVHSKYIACHPANRDGVGCVGSDCHSLLDDILAVGWDPSAPKPVCVEVRDTHDEVVAFNEKMIQSNNNLLAPLQTGCVKYASLSASHTNQVLRLLHAQHPHTHSAGSEGTAITVGGVLSMEQLRNTDALFHAAAAGGIEWQVVAEKVLQRFPALGELLQEAGNTSGQLQRSETEISARPTYSSGGQCRAAGPGSFVPEHSPAGAPVEASVCPGSAVDLRLRGEVCWWAGWLGASRDRAGHQDVRVNRPTRVGSNVLGQPQP